MAYGKWIGGWLGLMSGGILGGIAGFVLGSLFDGMVNSINEDNNTDEATGSQRSAFSGGTQRNSYGSTRNDAEGARNGFLFSLMVLSAHIIRADGRVMHSEMETVRRFLRFNFGEAAVEQGNDILLKLFEYRKQRGDYAWQQQIVAACSEMRMHMPEEQLTQLMAFLAEIVKADGKVDQAELNAMRELASALGLNQGIVDSLLALGGSTLDDAYKVLGLTSSATDDEVRRAYRDLVRRNHPDKVATLGEDVKEAAKRKMQEINEAKERIFKARGL